MAWSKAHFLSSGISAKAADHDVLADPDICFHLDLSVIAAWCDEFTVGLI